MKKKRKTIGRKSERKFRRAKRALKAVGLPPAPSQAARVLQKLSSLHLVKEEGPPVEWLADLERFLCRQVETPRREEDLTDGGE
jgi:hypothetical protein